MTGARIRRAVGHGVGKKERERGGGEREGERGGAEENPAYINCSLNAFRIHSRLCESIRCALSTQPIAFAASILSVERRIWVS